MVFSNLSYICLNSFSRLLYFYSQFTLLADNFYSCYFFISSSFLFSSASSALSAFSVLLSVSEFSILPPLLSLAISSIVCLVASLTILVSSSCFLATFRLSVFFLSASTILSTFSEFSFWSALTSAFSSFSSLDLSFFFESVGFSSSSFFSVGLSSFLSSIGFFSSFGLASSFGFSDFLLFYFWRSVSPFLMWSSILVIFAFSFFKTFFNSFLARPFCPLIKVSSSLTLPSCFLTALLASTKFCSICFIGSVIFFSFLEDFCDKLLTFSPWSSSSSSSASASSTKSF